MDIAQLELRARLIRENIITMLEEAGSGHSGGALGMADIFAVLYFHILRHDPKQPEWPERDRLVLSCGHIVPVRYAAMAEAGYFERKELLSLRKFGSRLQGHPHQLSLPGLETTSGPLGQGLSQAIGMSLAGHTTYAVLSDGEHNEGQTWEAILFAGSHKLGNLTAIIDRNFIQIDGPTEEILPLEPFADKYRAFNWHVIEIDGNDIPQILKAFEEAKTVTDKPTAIIAHTVPGKGVSFMENDYKWHGSPPNSEQADQALTELAGSIHG